MHFGQVLDCVISAEKTHLICCSTMKSSATMRKTLGMWHTTKITTIQARTHLKSKSLKIYRKDRKSTNITENKKMTENQKIYRNDRKSTEIAENLQMVQKINRNGRKPTVLTGEKKSLTPNWTLASPSSQPEDACS